MDCPKKITVTYHFSKDDPDFSGDYSSVDVKFDKVKVVDLSDYYHDKSDVYIDGFLDACKQIWGDGFPKEKIDNKADSKY